MKNQVLTRREFLKDATSAALAGALYLSAPPAVLAQSTKKTKVVLIRNQEVLDDLNRPRERFVRQMLDEAVTALLNESDPVRAWKRLIKPTDIVGIKSNVWHFLPTPPELEMAIKNRVMDAGVPEKNIGIRDRGLLEDSIFLNATALINVRPLRTHHWSGVGSLLKNYIMFVKDPSAYHPDSCADLAAIWKLPLVEGKTRLNILVLFTPLFHGVGPHHFSSQYTWAYKGLLVGFDPVAVDSTGVRILLAKRKEYFGEARPLNPPPKHIFLADTRHHLGTADPEKIDLVTIGWKDGLLI
ncbi:MAG: DUF362 domain-containing protein [candidate division KSB1 bacterium]|nr:DUF362 domain-containing protein [candidate division KSB1 bacterium]MDZ7301889.1 DUF362 domain-containing protein [candidate division KSB1 bacterium]MDZ7310272.1 DUF362 domain-containing protein [candidate division KSB1 bacterium]